MLGDSPHLLQSGSVPCYAEKAHIRKEKLVKCFNDTVSCQVYVRSVVAELNISMEDRQNDTYRETPKYSENNKKIFKVQKFLQHFVWLGQHERGT
jgi:hypothetical protein